MLEAHKSKRSEALQLPVAKSDIALRLAELNHWQEEQKRLLEERQSKQRQMLDLEQRNIYQMLGLIQKNELQLAFADDDDLDELEETVVDDQELTSTNVDEILANSKDCAEPPAEVDVVYNSEALDNDDDVNKENQTKPMVTNTQSNSDYGSIKAMSAAPAASLPLTAAAPLTKTKHPFLKRGDGLKQRFKMDPDRFRLINLPSYKFANAHPQYKKEPPYKKRGILKHTVNTKNKEPSASRDVVDVPPATLDLLGHFRDSLVSSTPDLKSSTASSKTASVSPKVHFVDINSDVITQKHITVADKEDSSSTANSLKGISWAKVLNTQNIKPILVREVNSIEELNNDDENMSIFELLEQKAREGNIDMNSSCIRAFMARKQRQLADDSDVIPIPEGLQTKHIEPRVTEQDAQMAKQTLTNEDTVGESTETSSVYSTHIHTDKAHIHVRFSNSSDTHELTEEPNSDPSTLFANDTTDTTDNVELFQQLKSALFTALDQRKAQADAAAQRSNENEEVVKELQEKLNLVKIRLVELEKETKTFKENNVELLHLKQEHELEKARYTKEHTEAMERLHNEKIEFEIYVHDERMKLEEERRKFEQQMRLQKSNANTKDKREIASLKQEIESLQLQLKQKEQMHVTAQARLRAQNRALEKEQKNFYEEIENLNKENKRLQLEAMKKSREQNNKMLHEINRNLARLAPKLVQPASLQEEQTKQSRSLSSVQTCCHAKTTKPHRQSNSGTKRERYNTRQTVIENTSGSDTGSDELELHNAQYTKPAEDNYKELNADSRNTCKSSNNESSATTIETVKTDATKAHDVINNKDFKREIVNDDGSKDIWYPNGNVKKISADGMLIRMLYFNKDIKETDIRGGTVKYYYAETNTWHTTYLDGLEILEYPNGQTEHRHKNGVIEVHFPNNTIKIVDPTDEVKLEEWRYADGTYLIQLRNGNKVLSLPNGQKEIHTKLNKRREYPDGTVKIVYPDGSQETRYSNGRIRLKDRDGKLIMDSDSIK